ncbi:uncharacterized protein [Solanum lycopersicum]|uniref:uncharacterized protein n=1 Tax=Solanum lycopersicum TaxID=4081 RepID=UPI0037493DBC
MSSPLPFVSWGLDVIGPIELASSNRYRFILVAIDYFTKWVKAASYKSVAKKVNVDWSYSILAGIWNRKVILAEVEISSLRIIQEVELSNAEWVRKRIDQLTLIDEKRMVAIYHGQLYRQRIIRTFHKRVRARIFEIGQLVLKRIFPHQNEYK